MTIDRYSVSGGRLSQSWSTALPVQTPAGARRLHSPLRWVLVQPASLDDWCDGGGAPRQLIHGVRWELRDQTGQGWAQAAGGPPTTRTRGGKERQAGAKGMGRPGLRGRAAGWGGNSLGNALISMAILIFFIPRQFLSFTQQTGHAHGPRDSAQWGFLLPPQAHSSSHTLQATTPTCPLHPYPQLSTFTSVSSYPSPIS